MSRSLQVYLDSSDYSNFASRNVGGEFSTIFEFLQGHVRSGNIEIRFSPIHISEATNTEKQYRNEALARANAIEALSNGKCVLEPAYIWNCEARCPSVQVGPDRINVVRDKIFRDDCLWFSAAAELAVPTISELVEDAVKQALESNSQLPRIERRRRLASIYKRGKLTPLGVRLVMADAENLPNFIEERVFRSWISGKLPRDQFSLEMARSLCRPTVFVHLVSSNEDHTKVVRGLAGYLVSSLMSTYSKFDLIMREFTNMQKSIETLGLKGHNWLKLEPEDFRQKIKKKFIDKVTSEDNNYIEPAIEMPSLDFLSSVVANHFQQFISAYKSGAVPKRAQRPESSASDSGDIQHLSYAPYFDLFRCDAYFADICKKSGADVNDHVVARLRDLPVAIEKKLTLRAKNAHR